MKYANRAKNIKTSVSRNVLRVDYHVSEYVGLIADLRSEILRLKEQLAAARSLARGRPDGPTHAFGEETEAVSELRRAILDNFRERMQLSASVIRTEDASVQHSFEVSKRQLIIVEWERTARAVDDERERDRRGPPVVEPPSPFAASSSPVRVGVDVSDCAKGSGGRGGGGREEPPASVFAAMSEIASLRALIDKNGAAKASILRLLKAKELEADKIR